MDEPHEPIADGSDAAPNFAERKAKAFYHWIDSGRYDKAVEAGKLALAETPDDSYLHAQMGYAYYQLDQPKEARTHLEASLSLDPNDPYPRSLLALVNSDGVVTQFSKVEQEALNTLRLDPEDYNAWFILAQHTITYDEAFSLNCCDRLIQLSPEHSHPYLTKARMLTACDKTDSLYSQRLIEDALRLEPDSDHAHETAAWFFLNDGKDHARGIKHLETALQINPDNAEALAMLNEDRIKRSWVVRILSLPWLVARGLIALVFKWTEFHDIVWIFTWWFVLAIGLLGLWIGAMWVIVCYPVKLLYEWLVLRADEAQWTAPSFLTHLFRTPLWLRSLIWLGFVSGYWYMMHQVFTNDDLKAGERIYFTVVYGFIFVALPLLAIWSIHGWMKKKRLKKQLPNTFEF